MSAPAAECSLAETGTARGCDREACNRTAVVAMRFTGQPGHVHVCPPCEAIDREWCDVAEVRPLPCPYPHDGTTWVAKPRELT